MALQIRRGPTLDRAGNGTPEFPGKTFVEGELVYDTTEKALYVGDGTTVGGKAASSYTDERAVDAVGAALVAGTGNVVFTYGTTQDNANRIDATVTLDGIGLLNVVEDTTPQLGGNLDLNSRDITGTGNVNITGTVTATGFTGPLTGNASTVTNGIYAGQKFYVGTTEIDIQRSSATQTLTGTSIDGNAGGNAATATKLAATKNINGVAFDGSADVTVITQGTGVTVSGSTISIGQAVATTSDVTFNNLTVSGDLTVNGTTTTLNTTTLDVEDLNINIAKNATSVGAADGAGITIGNYANSPTLTYLQSGDKIVINRRVDATSFYGDVTGNVTGNITGNVTGNVTSISANSFGTATITGGDGSNSSLKLRGYNQRGGLGYHGFLEVTNTYSSAANPNRYFRLDSDGVLEIVNCAYATTLLTLDNDGNMTVLGTFESTGNITAPGFTGPLTGNVITNSITTPTVGGKLTVTPETTFSDYVNVDQDLLVVGTSVSITGVKVINQRTPGFTTAADLTNTRATFNVPVRFGSYTTVQRDALTPGNGDVIYCTDSGPGGIGQFLGYANGAWTSLS
jgi:hypothetical protein